MPIQPQICAQQRHDQRIGLDRDREYGIKAMREIERMISDIGADVENALRTLNKVSDHLQLLQFVEGAGPNDALDMIDGAVEYEMEFAAHRLNCLDIVDHYLPTYDI
jgi:hypothetical protein